MIVPALPEELGKKPSSSTAEKWTAYWRSPVAQIAQDSGGLDLSGLYRWIINVDEWHRVIRALRSKRIVPGSMGQPTLNPLAGYKSSLETAIKDAEQQYGMTPMARLKLGIAVGQARLTAQELNRALEDNGDRSTSDDEWEEAH